MQTLTDHPITRRWPPQTPDVIQLYSFPKPNGQKGNRDADPLLPLLI